MNLEQTQNDFCRCLLSSTNTPEIDISGPAPAAQLLQLYRNNFIVSLTEMLEAVFPITLGLVGDEFFQQLTKSYILETPLPEASIENYGRQLPQFIGQCPQTQSLPYLADIAQLEWNLEQAKSCTEKAAFPFQQLAEVDQSRQGDIRFSLTPQAFLMRSEHPIFSIWKAVSSNNFEGLDMSQPECLIVIPGLEEGADLIPLNLSEFNVLEQISKNRPLSELSLTDNLTNTFEEHLMSWINTGIIDNFSLSTEECLA